MKRMIVLSMFLWNVGIADVPQSKYNEVVNHNGEQAVQIVRQDTINKVQSGQIKELQFWDFIWKMGCVVVGTLYLVK